MLNLRAILIGALFSAALPLQAEEPAYVSPRILSMKLAHELAWATATDCTKRGYKVSVAVTDRYGNLLAFVRNPLAGMHTVDVSQGKAYAAATFQTDTSRMMDNTHLRAVPKALLWGGGVPVVVAGNHYGAVGVAGAPAQKKVGDVDEECAKAGIAAVKDALEFAE